jgi:hypothetical protein
MRKSFLVSLIIALCTLSANAAEPAKIQVGLDYHYNFGFAERFYGHTYTRSDYAMSGNSLRLSFLYNINSKYTAGVGVGLENYDGWNTLPIFATFRYRPFTAPLLKDFYAFATPGYSVSTGDGFDITSGMVGDLGIGWTKMLRRHFGVNFQIGYQLKQIRFPYYIYDFYDEVYDDNYVESTRTTASDWRHSITFGFGLVF